jgi:hypothetical protein
MRVPVSENPEPAVGSRSREPETDTPTLPPLLEDPRSGFFVGNVCILPGIRAKFGLDLRSHNTRLGVFYYGGRGGLRENDVCF